MAAESRLRLAATLRLRSIRACIKNGKCATTEVVAASTPAPVSRGSRNRYAELAQLCVIEINLDLFLRNTLDPHFGHMLDAFDFGFE